ncbi:zinc protease [Acinetobacter haemolyticus]|uniref:zinc protease n=1 Tax=Acinetobacter haemolyticus TaxID=29430 RepID=UPI000DEBF3A2|nr:zinc protease [Acinetobacter haemolyticus]MCU4389004.1 zinc protease [Acinetobacter haemolyticus]WHR57591.1 zinc protease [Acinetobacter haemolyticus]
MNIVVSLKAKLKSKDSVEQNPTTVPVNTRRKLTSGEINLAKIMFKESIDYTKVEIIRGGLLSIPTRSKNAMTPFGSIHLPNEDYDKVKDFSIDKKATNKIWFIHEMAHVWQYQLGLNVAARGIEIGIRGGYSDAKAYDYDLVCDDQGKNFNQFNFEQQAEIISHYYDAYHLPLQGHNYPILHNKNVMQKFALKNVLKDFLADPSNSELLSKNYGGIYYHQEPKRY